MFKPPYLVILALGLLSSAGWGQTAGGDVPPKLVTQTSPTLPVAGAGTVTLKVQVKADGSVGSVTVVSSTNPDDNPAAEEIAKSSNYRPAMRQGHPIDAYYTMALKFTGPSATSDAASAVPEVQEANALIRTQKYAEAKAKIAAYLASHPSDRNAQAVLGVANAYLGDITGAVTAFDAAGSVPAAFKILAAETYSKAAVDALKAKNNDLAVALATKALALQKNGDTLYIRGVAYANVQKYGPAIADLTAAKQAAMAGKADKDNLNAIDASLVSAYLFGGQPDKGTALALELKHRDPGYARIDDVLVSYY